MLVKEIKIPMIVGTILYGFSLFLDLLFVLFQGIVYKIMGADFLEAYLDKGIFPFISVHQIIVMVMYIVFFLIMLRYKGTSRKLACILMTAVYCILVIPYPFISAGTTWLTGQFQGEHELVAYSTLNGFIVQYTSPFTTVSTVLLFIAIGRYGVSRARRDNTTDIKEGQ